MQVQMQSHAGHVRSFVRQVSPRLADCELTHLGRVPIDAARATRCHELYVEALREQGALVSWLPPLPHHPDGVFVEDIAVVLPEIAVSARPGAISRQAESDSCIEALAHIGP